MAATQALHLPSPAPKQCALEHALQRETTMNSIPHVVWKGFPPSEALNGYIQEELRSLSEKYPSITASRVAVEKPSRRHRHGGHFHVTIEVVMPGRVLVVSHDPKAIRASEDPWAAVSGAFDAIRRRVDDDVRYRRTVAA